MNLIKKNILILSSSITTSVTLQLWEIHAPEKWDGSKISSKELCPLNISCYKTENVCGQRNTSNLYGDGRV